VVEDEVSWTKDETSQLEDVVREKTAQIAALVSGLEALQVDNLIALLFCPSFVIMIRRSPSNTLLSS
jgi:hypothetical protein